MPDPTSSFNRRDFLTVAGGLLAAGALSGVAQAQERQPYLPEKVTVPPPAPGRLGWAVVGLGKLAIEQILPAFPKCSASRVVALVSGKAEKAKALAERYGVDPKNLYDYETFDKIADNPAIDVVYIVLPNGMHAEFTKRALVAGKHVFCEKPMANNPEEALSMIATSRAAKRELGVAYRIHLEPHNLKMREMVESRTFGAPKIFSSDETQNQEAGTWRTNRKLAGGGSLPDIGIYGLNGARFVLGEEPIEVRAQKFSTLNDPRFREVEESVLFQLRFPSGALAQIACSYGAYDSKRYRMMCADGWVEADPGNPYHGIRLTTGRKGETETQTIKEEIVMPESDQFQTEMDAFSTAILTKTANPLPPEEGLRDLRLIQAIYRSAETNLPVRLTEAGAPADATP
jgi:predicted dehydrogenase